jgi:hypothetical protein
MRAAVRGLGGGPLCAGSAAAYRLALEVQETNLRGSIMAAAAARQASERRIFELVDGLAAAIAAHHVYALPLCVRKAIHASIAASDELYYAQWRSEQRKVARERRRAKREARRRRRDRKTRTTTSAASGGRASTRASGVDGAEDDGVASYLGSLGATSEEGGSDGSASAGGAASVLSGMDGGRRRRSSSASGGSADSTELGPTGDTWGSDSDVTDDSRKRTATRASGRGGGGGRGRDRRGSRRGTSATSDASFDSEDGGDTDEDGARSSTGGGGGGGRGKRPSSASSARRRSVGGGGGRRRPTSAGALSTASFGSADTGDTDDESATGSTAGEGGRRGSGSRSRRRTSASAGGGGGGGAGAHGEDSESESSDSGLDDADEAVLGGAIRDLELLDRAGGASKSKKRQVSTRIMARAYAAFSTRGKSLRPEVRGGAFATEAETLPTASSVGKAAPPPPGSDAAAATAAAGGGPDASTAGGPGGSTPAAAAAAGGGYASDAGAGGGDGSATDASGDRRREGFKSAGFKGIVGPDGSVLEWAGDGTQFILPAWKARYRLKPWLVDAALLRLLAGRSLEGLDRDGEEALVQDMLVEAAVAMLRQYKVGGRPLPASGFEVVRRKVAERRAAAAEENARRAAAAARAAAFEVAEAEGSRLRMLRATMGGVAAFFGKVIAKAREKKTLRQRLAEAKEGLVSAAKNSRVGARRAYVWTKNLYYNVRKAVAEAKIRRNKRLRTTIAAVKRRQMQAMHLPVGICDIAFTFGPVDDADFARAQRKRFEADKPFHIKAKGNLGTTRTPIYLWYRETHDIREMITQLAWGGVDEAAIEVQDLLNGGYTPTFNDLAFPEGALWIRTEGGAPITSLATTADTTGSYFMLQAGYKAVEGEVFSDQFTPEAKLWFKSDPRRAFTSVDYLAVTRQTELESLENKVAALQAEMRAMLALDVSSSVCARVGGCGWVQVGAAGGAASVDVGVLAAARGCLCGL